MVLPVIGFLPAFVLWSRDRYQETGNILFVVWGCACIPFGLIGSACLVLVARALRKRDARARNLALFCSYAAIGLAAACTLMTVTAAPVVAFFVPGQALLVVLAIWSAIVLRRPEIRAEFPEA